MNSIRTRAAALPAPALSTKDRGTWPFTSSILISLASGFFISCMCGYIQPEALPFTITAAGLAWIPFVRTRRTRIFDQGWAILAVLISTLVLEKNLMDVIWRGHGALLG